MEQSNAVKSPLRKKKKSPNTVDVLLYPILLSSFPPQRNKDPKARSSISRVCSFSSCIDDKDKNIDNNYI